MNTNYGSLCGFTRKHIAEDMFDWLFYVLFHECTIELMFYFIADKITNYRVIRAKNNREKKNVLLEGFAMLSVLSFFIWLHHVPYIFLFMMVCTLIAAFKLTSSDDDLSWINKGLQDLYSAFLCENWLSNLANKTILILVIKPSKWLKKILSYIDGNGARMSLESHSPSKRTNQVLTKQNPNPQMSFAGPSWSSKSVAPTRTSSSTQHSDLPRGLANEGNLCFFNCVIQVLARLNYLTDELEKLLPFVGQNDHILIEILKVFTRLKERRRSAEPLQTSFLRKALFLHSKRSMGSNSCLIQLPDVGKQEEQDVAEFLTWILNLLSSSLKHLKQAEDLRARSGAYKELFKLRQMYNNPSHREIQQLRTFHARELSDSGRSVMKQLSNRDAKHIANLDWLYAWCFSNEKDATIVEDLFTGQSLVYAVCSKHGNVSLKTDLFGILHLAIPCNRTTIEECLAHYTSEEHCLDVSLHPQCTSCYESLQNFVSSSPLSNRVIPSLQNFIPTDILSPIRREGNNFFEPNLTPSVPRTSSPYTKTIYINRFPDCLVIQLLRFKIEPGRSLPGQTFKLRHRVRCGLRLDMEPYKAKDVDNSSTKYFLQAVILHCSSDVGSAAEGHYQAIVVTGPNKWHLFDDEQVYPILDIEKYLQQPAVEENVYLLFYSKCK